MLPHFIQYILPYPLVMIILTKGFSCLLYTSSAEEIGHAYAIAEYMIKREAIPKVDKVEMCIRDSGIPDLRRVANRNEKEIHHSTA